ncbi:hypothetical protein LXL04_010242 [Taraxacum kok-saghyz]
MVRESEWREVRRRKTGVKNFHGNGDSGSTTSFFVSGLPGDATKVEIWKLCSPFGNLVDVYIAGRKDASGEFFGFVRFKNLVNPGETEKNLGNADCKGRKLKINISKHPRPVPAAPARAPIHRRPHFFPPAKTDARSFADVAKGNSPVQEMTTHVPIVVTPPSLS